MIFSVNNLNISLETCEGVFPPTVAAKRFLEVLELNDLEKGKKVLDLGSGTGVFAIYLGLNGYTDILAVDNNENSLKCAEKNINLNKLEEHIEVRESDILSGIKPNEKFALIITNPSNLPEGIWKNTNDQNKPIDKEIIGGKRGNEVLITLAENIDKVMDEGRVVFLQPVYTNINHIKEIFIDKGFKINVLSRTVHKLSAWPWDEWKYDQKKLIEKLKQFEKEEGGKDYIGYENGEPYMVIEIVEAKR